jgi:hypothetical protein
MGKIVKSDFDIYAKGVKRLEELEKELDFLNVDKKFPSETASIRSKLKHVSEIPQIEYELKSLKDKISGKSKNVRKSLVSDSKIKELKKQIEKKSNECKKFAPLSKEVLKLKLEIHGLQNKIKGYEEDEKRKKQLLGNINVGVEKVFDDTMNLSLNDIKAKLSKEVENKEAQVQKELQRDLKRREELFNERYLELEKHFQEDYAKKVKEELKKEVSDKFDKKVSEELAKKTKASESELNVLKRKLKTEYSSKENILNQHFEKAIEEDKKREKELFNERILAEKIKLHKKLDSEIAAEILRIKQKEAGKEHELNEKLSGFSMLREKLIDAFRKKKDALENKEERIINDKLKDIERQRQELIKKVESEKVSLDRAKKRVELLKDSALAKARLQFEEEKKQVSNDLAKQQQDLADEKTRLVSLKNNLMLQSRKQIESEKELFEQEKRKEEEKILRQEEALKKKVEVIKAKLQEEYEEKLKEAIKIKEDEFKKKNKDLENQIKEKIKMFYK